MDNLQQEATSAQGAIGNVMTADNAKQILTSRKLITEPGKYYLKVTNSTPFERGVAGGDSLFTQIVNFNGMTPYQLQQAKAQFKAGNYQEATNIALTSSRRIGMDFTPKKGDICEVIVDYVPLRDFNPWKGEEVDPNDSNEDIRFPQGRKNQQGLLVVGVQAMPITKASNVSFDLEEDDLEASLVDENIGSTVNREASIDSAKAKGAGATPVKASNSVEEPTTV